MVIVDHKLHVIVFNFKNGKARFIIQSDYASVHFCLMQQ